MMSKKVREAYELKTGLRQQFIQKKEQEEKPIKRVCDILSSAKPYRDKKMLLYYRIKGFSEDEKDVIWNSYMLSEKLLPPGIVRKAGRHTNIKKVV